MADVARAVMRILPRCQWSGRPARLKHNPHPSV